MPSYISNIIMDCSAGNWPDIDQKTSQPENVEPEGNVTESRNLNNAGLSAMHNGNIEDSVIFFRNAVKENPRNIETRNNLAFAYTKQGNLEQATSVIYQVISLAPRRSNAWTNLADILKSRGQMDQAVMAWLIAIHFSSNRSHLVDYLSRQSTESTDDNFRNIASRVVSLSSLVPAL